MSTHFHTSHDGLTRVTAGAFAARGVFSEIFSAKRLPTYVLGVTVMAVVTATERALNAVDTGFAFEWAILTVVALTTFGLFARAIVRGTRATQSWFTAYAKRARQARSDEKLWATACRDPRVMNEILAAQGRSESFVAEAPKAVQKNAALQHTVNDDGLAPLAPWVQLTRYY